MLLYSFFSLRCDVKGFGALKLFSFRCFSYPDLSAGGFCAPHGLGAGVEGVAGALKLFTLCFLYFVYVVVGGFGALFSFF